MRTSRLSLSLVVVAVLGLAGCGSPAPPASPAPPQLFQDYLDSTHVANDEFTGVDNKADRIANMAAHYSRDELAGYLFAAYRCADAGPNQLGCPPPAGVTGTAGGFGGTLYERNILIQHAGGGLELMPLYLAVRPGNATELIDRTGRAYPGGLDDLRAHNTLLAADDQVLLADPVTAPDGSFQLRVVTGHTPADTNWAYLVVGVLALVAAALIVVFLVLRRRRHRPRHLLGEQPAE